MPWGAKLLYEEWASAEPGLRVWLHARVTHAVVEAGVIRGVAVSVRGGRIALAARAFVDATGDAELARLAGAPVARGEELQYPSTMFTMQHVDRYGIGGVCPALIPYVYLCVWRLLFLMI